MADFQSRMMNIQIKGTRTHDFALGHKEARHAAAEIVLEADREIERLRDACLAAEAALVGPSEEYDGCDEALRLVRAALGKG